MKREDTVRTLLNTISMFTNRDWGSPEKNHEATVLIRRIQQAVTLRDNTEMEKLFAEIQFFMSAAFVLFKRTERLVARYGQRKWQKPEDTQAWAGLMERLKVILRRRDGAELSEITVRIVKFLRERNEHVLAKNLDDALKMSKSGR